MFVFVSILAGVLAAGLVAPFAALAAGGTKAGLTAIQSMPADMTVPRQFEGSVMLMADGSKLAEF